MAEHPCDKCISYCTVEHKAHQKNFAWGCERYKEAPKSETCPVCGKNLEVIKGRCWYVKTCICGYKDERDSSD